VSSDLGVPEKPPVEKAYGTAQPRQGKPSVEGRRTAARAALDPAAEAGPWETDRRFFHGTPFRSSNRHTHRGLRPKTVAKRNRLRFRRRNRPRFRKSPAPGSHIRFSDSSWCVPAVQWLSTSPRAATAPVAGRFGRDRLHHFRIAYGSCQEAKTTVEILVLSGRLDRETSRQWWSDLHRIGGLLWGLMKSLQ